MIRMIDEHFEEFYVNENFGPQIDRAQVSDSVIAAFRGKLPDQLLKYWREYGWGGYGNGLMWLVDPREYSNALAAFIHGTGLHGKDRYYVYARSAFGELYVWGERTGPSLTISAIWSMIFPSDKSPSIAKDAQAADAILKSWFSANSKKNFDQTDINEEPLFDRAVKLLGRPGPDEMFGFVPALALGGPCRLDHLQKVKAVEHLMFLAQVQPPRVMLDIVQEAKKQGLM